MPLYTPIERDEVTVGDVAKIGSKGKKGKAQPVAMDGESGETAPKAPRKMSPGRGAASRAEAARKAHAEALENVTKYKARLGLAEAEVANTRKARDAAAQELAELMGLKLAPVDQGEEQTA